MRVYLIKRKGATIQLNMIFDQRIKFSNDKEISVGKLFFRKKDAKEYLQTLEWNECFEVIGATVDKSKSDNRKI